MKRLSTHSLGDLVDEVTSLKFPLDFDTCECGETMDWFKPCEHWLGQQNRKFKAKVLGKLVNSRSKKPNSDTLVYGVITLDEENIRFYSSYMSCDDGRVVLERYGTVVSSGSSDHPVSINGKKVCRADPDIKYVHPTTHKKLGWDDWRQERDLKINTLEEQASTMMPAYKANIVLSNICSGSVPDIDLLKNVYKALELSEKLAAFETPVVLDKNGKEMTWSFGTSSDPPSEEVVEALLATSSEC
jgi:hypothetical protein